MLTIKEKLIDRIDEIEDPSLLEELLNAANLEYEIERTVELSNEEKKAIDKGIIDADSGNTHSSSEASQLVKKWLNK